MGIITYQIFANNLFNEIRLKTLQKGKNLHSQLDFQNFILINFYSTSKIQ